MQRTIVMLLSIGFAAAAMAGEGQVIQAIEELPTFNQLDADADGRITPDEANGNQRISELFQTLDSDQDGVLNAEEYAQLTALKSIKPM